jgi:thiamine biosynthesis lipoprotein
VRSVALAPGVTVDPGGIGKGLAADIVVAELMELGATGAMVNLGGDLAAQGRAPTEAGWVVGVEDPRDRHRVLARVTIHSGGVCTSSRLRRTWCARDGRPVHHILDPRSGDCLATDIASITVVAGAAWWAEALSKAVFVEGDQDPERVQRLLTHAHALVITVDGERRRYGDRGVFGLA